MWENYCQLELKVIPQGYEGKGKAVPVLSFN
jgi:hypothetical protein